jgi:20S proteasome subunit alpha 7
MTCREGIIAVAKIIYEVHDEAKDKAFELELSWVCDESNKQHQRVCLLPPGYFILFCSHFP